MNTRVRNRARVRRRKNGTFQAFIQDLAGRVLWSCEHAHPYGTSNRCHQDSASKCGNARIKQLRQEQDNDQAQSAEAKAQG
jgi:hypothetical protein